MSLPQHSQLGQGEGQNWVLPPRKLGVRPEVAMAGTRHSHWTDLREEMALKSTTKIILSIAALTCSSAIAAQQLQLRANEPPSRYVSAASLKAAGGSLKIKTKNGNSFTIKRIETPRGYPSNCLVDRASLEKQVERLGLTGKIGPQGAVIKMKATREGNQTICAGSGSGCLVITSDWDPDDPVLPK